MKLFSIPTLVSLLVLLPLACGQRAAPLLDGPTTTTKDAAVSQDAAVSRDAAVSQDTTTPTADGVVAPAADVALIPDGTTPSPPCCKQPVCVNKGTKSEGWSDPCNIQPVQLGYCTMCEVACMDCGPGCWGNGWYTYCPSLKLVRGCECKVCKPECRLVGSNSEGWYDPCTNKLIAWATCGGCTAICVDPAQPSTGLPQPRFYSSCDKTKTTPITKALCIP